MKKYLSLLALMALATIVLLVNKYPFSTPDYVKDAQARVSSYLETSYGPVDCKSRHTNDAPWLLSCHSPEQNLNFEYSVYPARLAPYYVSRTFYLQALNHDAVSSADEYLMQYLKIDTSHAIDGA